MKIKGLIKQSGIVLPLFTYLVSSAFIVTTVFFGTSVLNNLHLRYIRSLSKDVVSILNEQDGGGTGFLMKGKSGKTFIMTNYHICDSTKLGFLRVVYHSDTYLVSIIKSYKMNDLCVLEAPSSIKSTMKTAWSLSYGERVYAIGHPLLEPITVTEGEISSHVIIELPYARNVEPKDCQGETFKLVDLSGNPVAALFGVKNECIRILSCQSSTLAILPGNSGSPVVNIWGNVIGVVFAGHDSGTHGYIVPLEDLKSFLGEL